MKDRPGYVGDERYNAIVAIAAGSALINLAGMLRRRGRAALPSLVPGPRVGASAMLACLAFSPIGVLTQNASLDAQERSRTFLEGAAKGVTFDRFVYEGGGINAFSFRYSGLLPWRLGSEVGVSLFPTGLPAGALISASDFGPSYNISVPGATLLVKAGGSAITGIAADIVFVPGFHFGGALVVRLDDRTGLRIDAIRHYYMDRGETEGIWSLGAGLTALPRIRL